MTDLGSVVIIGGGLAGAKTAEALRERGFTGTVVLAGAEHRLPYERPPLSKGYLAGSAPFDEAVVHPADWYSANSIELFLGCAATAIDPKTHTVTFDDGSCVEYDRLVLATGSAPRQLPVPGADGEGVHYLRTVEDADALKAVFGDGRRLVVIGAGWIGLEVAATARGAGCEVVVVESAELPLLGVLGPEIAASFADLHRSHGVDLRLGASVGSIALEDGTVVGVEVDGELVPADCVVIGVGAQPMVDLAEAAGLDIDNGVLVDASLRTSDPDIYAVGDIAHVDHPVLGRRIRVEHWATALNQPAVAAAALLGEDARWEDLPYFFSDQYDLGMEYIGNAPPGSYDQVVIRGDLAGREYVAFWLDESHRMLAAMNVNVWDVIDQVKPLIAARAIVDPAKLGDPDVTYDAL
jgi:NADPH-dependent 2,4-dienoyl-CoA reductase/sulfur reductase-like enzyme